jgi:hypothetical protein
MIRLVGARIMMGVSIVLLAVFRKQIADDEDQYE